MVNIIKNIFSEIKKKIIFINNIIILFGLFFVYFWNERYDVISGEF